MKNSHKVLLLLDFDGTLSPIVDDPQKAILPHQTRRWLQSLLKKRNIKVGIVTGRSLLDIRKRVALKGLIYAANHGMEIFAGGRMRLSKGKKFLRPIRDIEERLLKALSDIPGVSVEMKGASLSIHYRKVKAVALQKQVISKVKRVTRGLLRKNGLQLTSGKMVVEVRPQRYWNKGCAALWIWRHLAAGYFPVYIGDDVTDEDAFLALRPHGVTIVIGNPRKTAAHYRMKTLLG